MKNEEGRQETNGLLGGMEAPRKQIEIDTGNEAAYWEIRIAMESQGKSAWSSWSKGLQWKYIL
jgi:hypothetical protein